MANRGVKGRIDFAEAGDPPIPNIAVAAVDLDPFHGDDPLGKEVRMSSNGEFTIDYSPSTYRLWIFDRKPDIEVRVYGPGKRVLWQSEVHEDVDAEFLTLDPANGTPIRLTTGNPAIAINNVGSNVGGAGMLRKY